MKCFMVYFFKVRDLLNPATLKIKGGLKVRQHPKLGFYGRPLFDLRSVVSVEKCGLIFFLCC